MLSGNAPSRTSTKLQDNESEVSHEVPKISKLFVYAGSYGVKGNTVERVESQNSNSASTEKD